MVLELWTNDQADQVNRINGGKRSAQAGGGDNLWTRTSAGVRGKHAHAQAELMQGCQCQSVYVQFLPGFCQRQKKADF